MRPDHFIMRFRSVYKTRVPSKDRLDEKRISVARCVGHARWVDIALNANVNGMSITIQNVLMQNLSPRLKQISKKIKLIAVIIRSSCKIIPEA
jgi:hypothetical protein